MGSINHRPMARSSRLDWVDCKLCRRTTDAVLLGFVLLREIGSLGQECCQLRPVKSCKACNSVQTGRTV